MPDQKKMIITCAASDNKAIIKISGYISGWKNSGEEFSNTIEKLVEQGIKDCEVHLNTGGGSVFDAHEIANQIKQFKGNIVAVVGALCASAGTVILVACKKRKGSKNSQYMIHKPSVSTYGNEDDHASSLKLLQNIKEAILDSYIEATGMKKEEIEKLWIKDYWMTSKEALSKGFITEVLDENIVVEDSVITDLINSLNFEEIPASVMMNLNEFKSQNETNINSLNKITKTKIDMDVKLIASILNLPTDKQDEQSVTLAVQEVMQENATLKADNKTMKEAATKQVKDRAETLVNDAIASNKIKATEKEEFVQHATDNYELTRKLLEAKQPYKPVTLNAITGGAGATDSYANYNYDKLWKEAPKELARIKAEEPERFKTLYDAFV